MPTALSPRERLLIAINRGVPDRLPATTHHLQPCFLERYVDGIADDEFFARFELDAIRWITPLVPLGDAVTVDEKGRARSEHWRIEEEILRGNASNAIRYRIATPAGTLTMVIESDPYSSWITEYPIKRKADIDILGAYMPSLVCNIEAVNSAAVEFGDRGIIRGNIPGFELFGQPGCWQDAACLVGIERLILATFDDSAWVHALLDILLGWKKDFVRSLVGARYDILELGGGDASTTVISPRFFQEFVAPYDSQLIELSKRVGQRIVYHTCGGMMPILEDIAAMGPAAMETFTPPEMGGDVDLAEAKRRLGDRVCMIGGFDQFHHFVGCSPEQTRAAVRAAFEAAGGGGAFILSPSDHFFEAELALIAAYSDEARRCIYD